MKSWMMFGLGVVVGGFGFAAATWDRHGAMPPPTFTTPFQSVLLDTGQLYFGKLEGLATDYPILRDVYYIQSTTDPKTQQVTNALIRRGKEWHGPEYMVLNARHISAIEPVGPSSKVAAYIAEQEKQK